MTNHSRGGISWSFHGHTREEDSKMAELKNEEWEPGKWSRGAQADMN